MRPSNRDENTVLASALVKRLEDREALKSGHPLAIARRAIARRLQIAPGALENLRRNRTKEPRQ